MNLSEIKTDTDFAASGKALQDAGAFKRSAG